MQDHRRLTGTGPLRLRLLLGLTTAGLTGIALVAPAASAQAAPRVEHVNDIDLSTEFVSPFLSDACGFPVTSTTENVADVTLFYDENGLIIREIQRSPGGRSTLSGNGNSITFSLPRVQVFTYPSGATIGAPASGKFLGADGHVPGIGATAGQYEVTGTVTGFTPEGLPIVTVENQEFHGNEPSPATIIAAICGALED